MKTVVITGASTGIGRACALELDRRGWRVFAGVRQPADAAALAGQSSPNLTPVFIDVTDSESIAAAAEQVTATVGPAGLTGLVNNAGIGAGGPLEFIPIELLRQQFEINVIGQVAVTQAFLPLLRAGRGRIINMSSISGRVSVPFVGPYSASKFALEALTNSLRNELQPWGIKVISIQPGSIATPIWEKTLALSYQLRRQMPPRAEDLYGARLDDLLAAVKNTAGRGVPPERVARVVHTALTAARPKLRYLVGADARLAALLVALLPDRLFDWLLIKYGGNI
ncbi:MAG: Diacetyl reductase [(S)-acetoin forming] [Anaerolineae bacterium]|nr:Diacetyl reductase [(S)-acetoin forming] [Anaerolineae bacterium]